MRGGAYMRDTTVQFQFQTNIKARSRAPSSPELSLVPLPISKATTCIAPLHYCTTLWGEPDRVHVQNME